MSRHARAFAAVASAVVLGVSLVLLVSGLLKAVEPEAFRAVLERQGLLPEAWLGPTTTGVWVVEMAGGLIGAWLVIRQSGKGVAIGALALAAVFLAFSLYAVALTVHPPPKPSPCGCFLGTEPVSNWTIIAVRNGLGAIALATLALFSGGVRSRRLPR